MVFACSVRVVRRREAADDRNTRVSPLDTTVSPGAAQAARVIDRLSWTGSMTIRSPDQLGAPALSESARMSVAASFVTVRIPAPRLINHNELNVQPTP